MQGLSVRFIGDVRRGVGDQCTATTYNHNRIVCCLEDISGSRSDILRSRSEQRVISAIMPTTAVTSFSLRRDEKAKQVTPIIPRGLEGTGMSAVSRDVNLSLREHPEPTRIQVSEDVTKFRLRPKRHRSIIARNYCLPPVILRH